VRRDRQVRLVRRELIAGAWNDPQENEYKRLNPSSNDS